jgi:hypothetical protein
MHRVISQSSMQQVGPLELCLSNATDCAPIIAWTVPVLKQTCERKGGQDTCVKQTYISYLPELSQTPKLAMLLKGGCS